MGSIFIVTSNVRHPGVDFAQPVIYTKGWLLQVEDDPTGGKFAGATGLLNGAPNKLEDVINFHVGDAVTSLQRSALQPGGQEVVIYSTLMGSLGSMLPFTSRRGHLLPLLRSTDLEHGGLLVPVL